MSVLETKDLILRKAMQEDWCDLYHNIWRHAESAKYMLWNITVSEADAKARMERVMQFEARHNHHWIVVEKVSGQAIGWAGMDALSPGVWGEEGIAIGPAFTGRGYGKQILNTLTDYAREQLGARIFAASCRSGNVASRKMLLSSGFHYTCSEQKTDVRKSAVYTLEHYEKAL